MTFKNVWLSPGDTFYALPGTKINPTSEVVGIKVMDAEFIINEGFMYRLQTPFGIYKFRPEKTPEVVKQLRWKRGRNYLPLPIKLLTKKGDKWWDRLEKQIVRVIESYYSDMETLVFVEAIKDDGVHIYERYFSMGNFQSLTKEERKLHSKQRRQLCIKQIITNRP